MGEPAWMEAMLGKPLPTGEVKRFIARGEGVCHDSALAARPNFLNDI